MSQRAYEDRKLYQQKYQRERAARLRGEFMTGKLCARCGGADRLELHHRDPQKKAGHKIWSWAKLRREAEISKCEVLCRPCHNRHHLWVRYRNVRILLEHALKQRAKQAAKC